MITLTPRISSHKHDSVYIFLLDSKKNFSEKKKKKQFPAIPTPPFFNSMKQKTFNRRKIFWTSPPGHFTDPDRFPPWETSYQFLAVISVRRWKLILERLRLTNSCEPKVLSVEAVCITSALLEKEICIWDMLIIFSC